MRARILIVIGLFGGAGYIAHRTSRSGAEPPPLVVKHRDTRGLASATRTATTRVIEPEARVKIAELAAEAPDDESESPPAPPVPAEVEDERDEPIAIADGDLQHGAVQGQIRDASTGEVLVGVTVCATSPALDGVQTAITDEQGFYKITGLPVGDYLVTFYYLELTVERPGVAVRSSRSTPVYQKLDANVVRDIPPSPDEDTMGITIDQEYIKNIPVPGRTFESVLGAAAGEQGDPTGDSGSPDDLGVSFSGGSSLENEYYIDD